MAPKEGGNLDGPQRATKALAAAAVALSLAAAFGPAASAGGPGPTGPLPLAVTTLFENVSAASGLSGNLSIHNGSLAALELQRGFLNGGRGVCFTDFDIDGDEDLYLVGPGASQMFRNDGGWNFTEVTNATGLWASGYGMGCGSADLDDDGDEDIWSTDYDNGDSVFRNNGDGTFTNVTAASNVTDRGPHTSVAFGDLDNDGLLDVVVASYNRYQDLVYRNLGGLRFEERQDSSGMYDADWGFQPLIFDMDADGDVDVYMINDFGFDRMWRNDGNWTFADVSVAVGAYDPGGGMGGDVTDVDHDGDLDFYVANYNENALWVRNGSKFEDRAAEAGVDNASTGWASLFFDYDNDGWDDLYVVNGVVDSAAVRYQSNVLYHGLGALRFEDVSGGSGVESAQIGRGAAVADLDGDGMVDIYETNVDCPNEMLRNAVSSTNRWLGVRLRGTVSNTDGVGAVVTVRAGNLTQMKPMMAGTGYLTTSSKTLHFGLGNRDVVDSVEIRWPSGLVQTLSGLAVNATHLVSEQDGEAPLAVAGDVAGLRGLPIALNGSAASDNVRIVDWNWTVDENGTLRSAAGEAAEVRIYSAGNFSGTLEVRDPFGNVANASFRVSVGAFSGAWADAGQDFAVDEGVEAHFVAGGGTSETPDFEGTSAFTWTFIEGGEPRTLTGARPDWTFTSVGRTEVRLHVVDAANHTADDFVNVTVRDVTAPLPRATLPSAVDEDVAVVLVATASTDNDPSFPAGAAAEWSYLTGAGPVTVGGFSATTTFADPGVFLLTLRVTDAGGNTASMVYPLVVRDTTPPTAVAGGDRSSIANEPVNFSAAGSTDNGGNVLQTGNFTWTIRLPLGAVLRYGPETAFAFPQPGSFAVELVVRDGAGNAAPMVSFLVTVADTDTPIPGLVSPRVAAAGRPFMFDASGSTDADPSFASSGTFAWEFDDGGAPQRLAGIRANYTFALRGNYSVLLVVSDAAGHNASMRFNVEARDGTPPTIGTGPLPTELEQGKSLFLNASATTDDFGPTTLTWLVKGPFAFEASLGAAEGPVALGLPGLYNVTVTAVDGAGNAATRSFDVRVIVATPNPGSNGTNNGTGGGGGGGNGTAPPGTNYLGLVGAVIAGCAVGAAAALVLRRRRRGAAPPQAE